MSSTVKHSDNLIEFSGGRFLYFVFILTVCLNDYIQTFSGMSYAISMLLSLLCIVAVLAFCRKRISITFHKENLCGWDIVFILVFGVLAFLRAVMPDACYDTSNYHLYYQEFLDRDIINGDFFPIRAVNASTLVLGDRMFYFFKTLLGYRMGTMLNIFCIFIVYFQLKEMFQTLLTKCNKAINNWMSNIVAIAVTLCLMTENIFSLLSTYMIDLLLLPLILEIVLIVWKTSRIDIKWEVIYLCLLTGMATAIKMSNAIIIVPLAIIYIIKSRKQLKISYIIAGACSIVGVLGIYLFCSWKITGNPIFPYLNGIFQSPYFSFDQSPNDFSAFNERFGPKSALAYIFWPIYMLAHPEKTSDIVFCSGRVLVVCIIIGLFLLISLFTKRKINEDEGKMLGILSIFYVIFLFIFHGYMRYIIPLELMGSVMACYILFLAFSQRSKIQMALYGITCGLFAMQVIWSAHQYICRNFEWSWRDIKNMDRISANLTKVFNDYGTGIEESLLNQIKTFLVVDASGSLAVSLKDDVPIINLTSSVTSETTQQMLAERLQTIEDEGIYSLGKREDFDGNILAYSAYGFRVEEIMSITPDFYDARNCLPLVKLAKTDKPVEVATIKTANYESAFEFKENVESIDIFFGDDMVEEKWNENQYYLCASVYNNKTGEEKNLFRELISQRGEYKRFILNEQDLERYDGIRFWKETQEMDPGGEQYMIILQQNISQP